MSNEAELHKSADEQPVSPQRLAEHMPFVLDDVRRQRQWMAIADRLDRRGQSDTSSGRPARASSVLPKWWHVPAGLALAASLALFVWPLGSKREQVGAPVALEHAAPDPAVPDPAVSDPAVSDPAASALTGLELPEQVTLPEGSRVAVGKGARVDLVESARSSVRLRVRSGQARFAVTHAPNRERFEVTAEDILVEVVGTKFSVEVSEDAEPDVIVTVTEGKVRVTSGTGEPVYVAAGESWSSRAVAADTKGAVTPASGALDSAPAGPVTSHIPSHSLAQAGSSERPKRRSFPGAAPPFEASPQRPGDELGIRSGPLQAAGEAEQRTRSANAHRKAPRAALSVSMAERQDGHFKSSQTGSVQPLSKRARRRSQALRRAAQPPVPGDLFTEANTAIVARRYGLAAQLLETFVEAQASDARAALAAFELGRLRLQHLNDTAGAISAFDLSLALSPSGALAEHASARRVEAFARAADLAACRRARATYEQAYPKGAHRNAIAALCP